MNVQSLNNIIYHSILIYPFLVAINCIANYICLYISNTSQLSVQFYHYRNEILQLSSHIKYIHTGVTMVTTALLSDWLNISQFHKAKYVHKSKYGNRMVRVVLQHKTADVKVLLWYIM